jgi:hypothetical protein
MYVKPLVTIRSNFIYHVHPRVEIIPAKREIGPLLADNNLQSERYWHGQIKDIRRSGGDHRTVSDFSLVT